MNRYLSRARVQAEAAQRRRRIAIWLEHLEAMERTPAHTPEEQLAKREALELMRRACPDQSPPG